MRYADPTKRLSIGRLLAQVASGRASPPPAGDELAPLDRLELALAAYGNAAAYQVAEVTTAATYEIAQLYYRLSQDLIVARSRIDPP